MFYQFVRRVFRLNTDREFGYFLLFLTAFFVVLFLIDQLINYRKIEDYQCPKNDIKGMIFIILLGVIVGIFNVLKP